MSQTPEPVEPGSTPTGDAPPNPRRARRRALRIILIATAAVAVLMAGTGVALGLYVHSIDSKIPRINAFTGVPPESRPQKAVTGAENLLILGSDTRDPTNTSGSRSDTIILAHLPKDRGSAQLISIPRDTWVHIPRSVDGRYGNQNAKINAAFAWGGVPLVVQTMESFTGVRVEHVIIVDFAGFKEIIDALDGVDIDVDQNFTSTHAFTPTGTRVFTKGLHHMDGATALDYSRERYSLAGGDFARIRHQQQMIKAVLDKAASGGMLTDPGRLNAFLTSAAEAVTIDETLSLFDLAMELRHLRSGNLTFATSPSRGTGTVGGQSVVYPDTAKDKTLYDAVRRDAVPEILSAAG
jgi:LCP family protein required for cell wall assembly